MPKKSHGQPITVNIPTAKQVGVAQDLVRHFEKHEFKSGAEILKKNGYGKKKQEYPKLVFQSKGVQKALGELGYDIDSAKKVVAHIMTTGSEFAQLQAAQTILKTEGAYAPTRLAIGPDMDALKAQEEARRIIEADGE